LNNALRNCLTYREHRPPRDLLPWVAAYWRIVGVVSTGANILHRVLPDGCADLLFDLQVARDSGGQQGLLVGPMLAAHSFQLSGTVDVVGVRFRPGGASQFCGASMQSLRDDTAPLSDLPALRRFNVAQLAELPDSSSPFRELTASLRRRLLDLGSPDLVVGAVLGQLAGWQFDRIPTVSAVVRSMGISERALERRFSAQVGLTPVQFRRLSRFRAALQRYASGCTNWSAIAHLTGYSDQSHLVREFHAWSGLTPTAWAASQASDAGFIQDGSASIA
jgi:AraC-like DNA-binding protein